MHINISTLILAAGLTSVVASLAPSSTPVPPSSLAPSSTPASSSPVLHHRSPPSPLSLREQNRLAVELLPPSCNLNACLGLTGTISCIASALASGDPTALARCLTNGMTAICQCAACIPTLTKFLNALGICVVGANPTLTPSMQFSTFVTSPAFSLKDGFNIEMVPAPTETA